MNRAPYLQKSGMPIEKDGELVTPYAFRHPCAHPGCVKEGSFGFGVNLRRKKPGTWFCYEHRGDGGLTIGAQDEPHDKSPATDPTPDDPVG